MTRLFHDRREAGMLLANKLSEFRDAPNALILALPRGGVPIAAPIARHLHLPMDVLVVRKLGTPGHLELAMGAIGRGGVRVLNDDIIARLKIKADQINEAATMEENELEHREALYRGRRKALPIVGHHVILVDDGLATGATMRAAVAAVRQLDATRVTIAVPVGSWEACKALACVADDIVCLATPEPFDAIGIWYEEFPQVTDEEVHHALNTPLAKRRMELV